MVALSLTRVQGVYAPDTIFTILVEIVGVTVSLWLSSLWKIAMSKSKPSSRCPELEAFVSLKVAWKVDLPDVGSV